MPVIVRLADAIGSQTETMVLRALAAGPMMLGRLLLGELAVGRRRASLRHGPVVAVVQDLLSLLIYFVCVRLLT